MPDGGVGEQVEIKRIIALLEKRPLAPVAALRHRMRNTGQNDTRKTTHA